MSRSALVTMRWSKTKLPLSEPATTPLAGQPVRAGRAARGSPRAGLALLGGHAHGDPEPEGVEMAVERVGLPPGRAAAARTGGVDEVRALGQRVAVAGGRRSSGSSTGSCSRGTGTVPQRLAVDDRDRGAPGALARDREVLGLVAHGRAGADARASSRAGAARSSPCGRHPPRPKALGDHLVGAVALGNAEDGGRAEAAVDARRDEHRQQAVARGRGQGAAGVDQRDRARRRASCAPGRPSAAPPAASRTLRIAGPGVDLGMLGGDQHEARRLQRVGVGREHGQGSPSGARRSSSTPSTRPSTKRWLASATSSQLPFSSSSASRRSFSARRR